LKVTLLSFVSKLNPLALCFHINTLLLMLAVLFFFFSSRRRHTRSKRDWSSDVCSSDLAAVDKSNKKLKLMDTEEVESRFNEIYTELADIRHVDPAGEEAPAGIEKWFVFLNELGDYSLEACKGMGDMYVYVERFEIYIDKFGDGLAEFMQQAMAEYYEQNK